MRVGRRGGRGGNEEDTHRTDALHWRSLEIDPEIEKQPPWDSLPVHQYRMVVNRYSSDERNLSVGRARSASSLGRCFG